MNSEASHYDAVLLLEDGTYFKGKAAGIKGIGTGEICFNTGMTGYQEIFTDPSYFGQILVTTNAHIGNYGVKQTDTESDTIQIAGLVCKNFTDEFSRPMADNNIQSYFEENQLVCIHQVDTRAIVRHIRSKGAMNCLISTDELDIDKLKQKCSEIPSMAGLELASKVSTKETYTLGDENADIRIAVMDFGVKKNILRCMSDRGAYLKVFPAKATLSEMQSFNPDGYFLSNGPGDPASMHYAVDTIKEIMEEDKPLFGICLGHQLLALACDIPTYKMHHGHRGINHPVKNMISGKCEVTSQNHGFGVSPEALNESDRVEITHVNLNDDTIEGIRVKGKNAFSVQYHPESSPGPHDSRYLFDEFLESIRNSK
jgi:carbamoyl-phosphate synthase small subunit